MPAKNHLSQEQKERLLRAMRENEIPRIRERYLREIFNFIANK